MRPRSELIPLLNKTSTAPSLNVIAKVEVVHSNDDDVLDGWYFSSLLFPLVHLAAYTPAAAATSTQNSNINNNSTGNRRLAKRVYEREIYISIYICIYLYINI